jgi:hypothetical protein
MQAENMSEIRTQKINFNGDYSFMSITNNDNIILFIREFVKRIDSFQKRIIVHKIKKSKKQKGSA